MEALFFAGNQLIATSHTGRIGGGTLSPSTGRSGELASLAASFPSRLGKPDPRRGSFLAHLTRKEPKNLVVGQMQCQGEVGHDKGLMRIWGRLSWKRAAELT